MSTLFTKRLIIRPWQISDAKDLFEYASSTNVGPRAGWAPHQSIADSINLIKNLFMKELYHWALVLPTHNNKVIGGIGVVKDSKRTFSGARQMGYSMGQPFWGNEYMTEAAREVIKFTFEQTNTQILCIYHYSDNQRSRRVIEKCGFTYEGCLRGCSQPYYNSPIHDDCCYSMTRDEYHTIYGSKQK